MRESWKTKVNTKRGARWQTAAEHTANVNAPNSSIKRLRLFRVNFKNPILRCVRETPKSQRHRNTERKGVGEETQGKIILTSRDFAPQYLHQLKQSRRCL